MYKQMAPCPLPKASHPLKEGKEEVLKAGGWGVVSARPEALGAGPRLDS